MPSSINLMYSAVAEAVFCVSPQIRLGLARIVQCDSVFRICCGPHALWRSVALCNGMGYRVGRMLQANSAVLCTVYCILCTLWLSGWVLQH